MADVVSEGESFDQILVEPQRATDGAGDGRDFERVRQSRAMVIAHAAGEDLSLVSQAAERAGMDDAVAVTLVWVAIRMRRLGMRAAGGIGGVHGIRRQWLRAIVHSRAAFNNGFPQRVKRLRNDARVGDDG